MRTPTALALRLAADLEAGRINPEQVADLVMAAGRKSPAEWDREDVEFLAELRQQEIVSDIAHSDPMCAGATAEADAYRRVLAIARRQEEHPPLNSTFRPRSTPRGTIRIG